MVSRDRQTGTVKVAHAGTSGIGGTQISVFVKNLAAMNTRRVNDID